MDVSRATLLMLLATGAAWWAARADEPGAAERASQAGRAGWRMVFKSVFNDARQFERQWQHSGNVRLARGLQPAVQLGPADEGAAHAAELLSRPLDCAERPAGELSYWLIADGVDPGEALVVEVLTAQGEWTLLERVISDGRSASGPALHVRRLPAEALWGQTRVRFRALVDDADDRWLISRVELRAAPREVTLEVNVRPALEADIQVALLDGSEQFTLLAPGVRRFPAATRLYLLAPPSAGGLTFSHWLIDGPGRFESARGLALVLARRTRLTAVYRAAPAGQPETLVNVYAAPAIEARLLVGVGAGGAYLPVAGDGVLPCLMGELLTVVAPRRTARYVFERWVVNGQPLTPSGNVLRHEIIGTDVLVAEYALLGDMNDDGVLDKYDVDVFLLALVDPDAYRQHYPQLDRLRRGDINGDGQLDVLDVEPFVDLVLGG